MVKDISANKAICLDVIHSKLARLKKVAHFLKSRADFEAFKPQESDRKIANGSANIKALCAANKSLKTIKRTGESVKAGKN